MDTLLKSCSKLLRLVVVYRPPPSNKSKSTNELFFEEFGSMLEQLATDKGQVMIVGDFNFHIDDHSNSCAVKFMELLQTFDYTQHVKQPTHKGNHILDLIITRSEDNIIHRTTVVDPVLSDHYAVRCKVLFAKPPLEKIDITYRNLKRIDYSRFREEIKDLKLMHEKTLSLNDLVERYNTKLASLLNNHAPVRNKVVTLRPKSPWFTPEIKDQKAKLRRLERRWRKSRQIVDREIYTQ